MKEWIIRGFNQDCNKCYKLKTTKCLYGLPLDNRERYTKNDWITWTATLADNINDFRAIFDPVYDFANNTPDRVPLSDWYIVDNARQVGFQARSVVGGFFIKMPIIKISGGSGLENNQLIRRYCSVKY